MEDIFKNGKENLNEESNYAGVENFPNEIAHLKK